MSAAADGSYVRVSTESGMSETVKSFGRREAYESLRGTTRGWQRRPMGISVYVWR